MKFECESCGKQMSKDITCHGHEIGYQNNNLVCLDCEGRELSDQEIKECLPRCCNKPMSLK